MLRQTRILRPTAPAARRAAGTLRAPPARYGGRVPTTSEVPGKSKGIERQVFCPSALLQPPRMAHIFTVYLPAGRHLKAAQVDRWAGSNKLAGTSHETVSVT